MGDVSNKASPLPLVLPAKDIGLANTTAFVRNKQANLVRLRNANRVHDERNHPTEVRSNRSSRDNRRTTDLRQDEGRTERFREAQDVSEFETSSGEPSNHSSARETAGAPNRADSPQAASTLNAYVAPQTPNPAASTRSATQARFTQPENWRRGSEVSSTSARSQFEADAEKVMSLGRELVPNAFLQTVEALRGKPPATPQTPGSEAAATEGHEVTREEHVAEHVQGTIATATSAAQTAAQVFTPMKALRSAQFAVALGMGPLRKEDLVTGKDQERFFEPSGGPVSKVIDYGSRKVVYDADLQGSGGLPQDTRGVGY